MSIQFKKRAGWLFHLAFAFLVLKISAQETQKIFLSGKDFRNPVEWEFMCTDGNNSNSWRTINVPSNWEMEGFGTYTYGRWYKELKQEAPSKEEGFYKYEFKVPAKYKGHDIAIVFGGAMTDTQIKINGLAAGDIHQGGFYEFSYDITSLVKFGKSNLLEVHVSKHSGNASVNNAERKADWWLFGGIYRPVWLEISPKTAIKHVSVDAGMNGNLTARLALKNIPGGTELTAEISPVGGRQTFQTFTFPIEKNAKSQIVNTSWTGIKTWDPENPNLYTLTLALKKNGRVLHRYNTRIGFRSLEFLKKDGIYLNGKKIIMKGINRHTIWPESGRSTDKDISVLDVNLIKDMNMNAVRFHYPPDSHFLDVCDSLGLFVLDELAGWQNSYDTEVGKKLVKEMVQRDVNHPSVIIWDNGNEGGWNHEVDSIFTKYDPQDRIVIHPWADFNGWDTHHYPTYLTGMHRFNNGENVFFPTEFMHGTYDNGIGAGLEDFWNRYKESPLFAGAFIWALVDEAVLRTDWTGEQQFDSKGSLAPDGVLGPHREKEGSFFTVKEVWSPIQFEPKLVTSTFDGTFFVRNDYLFSNLNTCTMEYRVMKAEKKSFYSHARSEIIATAQIDIENIEPGETRKIHFVVPTNFYDGDWLEITAHDQHGREIYTWSWPIHRAPYYTQKFLPQNEEEATAKVADLNNSIQLSSKKVTVTLNATTGEITGIKNSKGSIPFINGPRPVGMKAKVEAVSIDSTRDAAICHLKYSGGIDSATWTLFNDGRLKLEMILLKKAGRSSGFDGAFFEDAINKFGITFDFPEAGVESVKWLGNGPYHVWKNRVKGTTFGLWEKDYNNTITGESFENLVYPEFKGYHAHFIGANLKSDNGSIRFFSENDNLFLRLFTPDEPENALNGTHPQPEFPEGNISFMYEIPAMRAFKPIAHQGPNSQPTNIRIKNGDDGIPMVLWFDFRDN